jgi:hypothetical protein
MLSQWGGSFLAWKTGHYPSTETDAMLNFLIVEDETQEA